MSHESENEIQDPEIRKSGGGTVFMGRQGRGGGGRGWGNINDI